MVCDVSLLYDMNQFIVSLNPTFSGIWSATSTLEILKAQLAEVLILLFLEYGLRRYGIEKTGIGSSQS